MVEFNENGVPSLHVGQVQQSHVIAVALGSEKPVHCNCLLISVDLQNNFVCGYLVALLHVNFGLEVLFNVVKFDLQGDLQELRLELNVQVILVRVNFEERLDH